LVSIKKWIGDKYQGKLAEGYERRVSVAVKSLVENGVLVEVGIALGVFRG